jgi:hypothetical protein
MRARILFLSVIILLIIGCNKDDENIETNIDGIYTGIFERGGNNSNVELIFNNGTWIGKSETVKFPALCNGGYSISGNVITFENACAWTAEFDWTLILGDEWNYSLNGNLLILTKTNGDKYTLTKQ